MPSGMGARILYLGHIHVMETASQLPAPSNLGVLPHIILLEPTRKPNGLIENWEKAIVKYFPGISDGELPFSVVEGKMEEVDPEKIQCDCVVSPANSWGIMDGGYDQVLSYAFMGPEDGHWTLTNQVQKYIREQWHGYLPPGSCIIVPMPDSVSGPVMNTEGKGNNWGATSLACLPTMRVPENVRWHEDLIYNCMWSLLVAVKNWNMNADNTKINRVLLTGLATGYGGMRANKCAEQMILAARHFTEALYGPGHPRWKEVVPRTNEIVDTINLDKDRTLRYDDDDDF